MRLLDSYVTETILVEPTGILPGVESSHACVSLLGYFGGLFTSSTLFIQVSAYSKAVL